MKAKRIPIHGCNLPSDSAINMAIRRGRRRSPWLAALQALLPINVMSSRGHVMESFQWIPGMETSPCTNPPPKRQRGAQECFANQPMNASGRQWPLQKGQMGHLSADPDSPILHQYSRGNQEFLGSGMVLYQIKPITVALLDQVLSETDRLTPASDLHLVSSITRHRPVRL